MAIALCVLGTASRLVSLEHVTVMAGSLGNGERRKQGTDDGTSQAVRWHLDFR